MENKYFYCYSIRLKDFLKSQGLTYITKGINTNSGKPYFMFEKSDFLDVIIRKWNEIKI